jgi:hypothetical protein
VHATARVMTEAVGGEILITDEIRKHAEPQLDYSFLDSGLFWLRDSLSCGGCTRCLGTTPRRGHGPVLCEHHSPLSWNGKQRERAYASW